MKLEAITTPDALDAICPEWNMLLTHNATNEIFLTWEWQFTWWEVYHPGELHIITARDDAGALIGIAPWYIEPESHTLRAIGGGEVTDYLDVIVLPVYQTAFFEALADFLAGVLCVPHASYTDCTQIDKIDLRTIPSNAPILNFLPRLLESRGFSVTVQSEEVCPHIPLPTDFEHYLESLDKKQRHEIRRKLRRAEGATAEKMAWHIVGSTHDLTTEIETFLTLMTASHPNKAKFMSDPQNAAFFRAVIPRVAACGWLQLAFLTINDTPAAAYLSFDYSNRIVVYNSGLKPDTYTHLSPGIVLLAYLINYAIGVGRAEFDFLRGTEEYKYRMGAQDRTIMMLQASAG